MFDEVAERLAARPPREAEFGGAAPAAVLVPLFPEEPHGLCTLLTLRTQTVRDHKGQVSFPGGGCEEGDRDLLATALRETEEEVAVPASAVRVAGRLDDCATLTGYIIRPFVGLLRERPVVRPSPIEIEELLWVPLRKVAAPGACEFRRVETGGWVVESYVFDVDGRMVWGATARMLVELIDRLRPLIDR